MSQLEHFKRTPHPTREIFTRYNIPLYTVSSFLDIDYAYTSAILTGRNKTKKHDKKLWELVALVKKEKGETA